MTFRKRQCSNSPFHDAREDLLSADQHQDTDTPQSRSPSDQLAYADPAFLLRDELRDVRLEYVETAEDAWDAIQGY